DGLLPVAGLAGDLVAFFAQHLGQIQPDERFVLGDENTAWLVGVGHGCHSGGSGPAQRPRGHPLWWEAALQMPSYPNWQRNWTQNPDSVGSNPTEGTCVMSQGIGIVL